MRPFPRFTAAAVAGRAVFSRGSGAGADDGAERVWRPLAALKAKGER